MSMKLTLAAVMMLGGAATVVAQAAPVTVIPTGSETRLQGEADDYAQVCFRSIVDKGVVVWTSWDIGDDWYPVIFGTGGQMLYRLTLPEIPEGKTLKVKYVRENVCEDVTETAVLATVSNESASSCEGIASYQFQVSRDTDSVVVVPDDDVAE